MDPEGNNKALTTINYSEARIRETEREYRFVEEQEEQEDRSPSPLNNGTLWILTKTRVPAGSAERAS